MKPAQGCSVDAKSRGRAYIWVCIFFFLLLLFFAAGEVFATVESSGPGGCCWQQVYDGTTQRLTGSADRQYYDYDYKKITIYGRVEEYWAADCGWWYIGDTRTVGVRILDGKGETVYSASGSGTSKGRVEITYNWGSDDDPGLWNITVNATGGTSSANFTIYVRGKLNVTTITPSVSNPNVGQTINITATVQDNGANTINSTYRDNNNTLAPPTVTAYINGPGTSLTLPMSASGNNWITANFSLNATGDYKVKIKATDGNRYWVDGSGASVVSVRGNFPYASVLLAFVDRISGGLASDAGSVIGGVLSIVSGLFVGRRWNRG